MPRLAARQGLSSQQPRCHRIATSSPHLQTPPVQLVPLKWGIYFSHWLGGKFSFYRASARQRRETELCGHCPFFFLSRKLQSSLLFEGNYFYELVISSEDDSIQISPESSCMKQPEDPNQKKTVGEERWWSLNPEDPGVGVTPLALSSWLSTPGTQTAGLTSTSTSTLVLLQNRGGKCPSPPLKTPHIKQGKFRNASSGFKKGSNWERGFQEISDTKKIYSEYFWHFQWKHFAVL